MSSEPFLVLDRVSKRFGALTVLDEVSLAVAPGEVFALLGPSGSGKTTALRAIAGFETPDAGRVLLAGEDVTAMPPERRRCGMVFQHYALFPHLSVSGNVAFGLAERGDAAAERVAEVLALVDLAGFEDRPVAELSGGQQQRVALARALAPAPRLLLLDEPLSNLDPTLRERTRRQLVATLREVGITTVLVTHEQEEAFELGDRVAVLDGGRLEQIGTPEELYLRPATRFVAGFVGRASLLPGRLTYADGRPAVEIDGAAPQAAPWPGRRPGNEQAEPAAGEPAAGEPAAGDPVLLAVRPEAARLTIAEEPGSLSGRVAGRRYAGAATFYRVALDAGPEIEVQAGPDATEVGVEVGVAPDPEGPLPSLFGRGPER